VSLAVQRDLDDLRAGLERWLGRPVGVIRRPDPGYSCETLLVEDDLVVRLPPVADGIFPLYDLAQQAAAQEAAGLAGVPVAAPVRYEADPTFLGTPFVAMPFVHGPIPAEFTPTDPWLGGLPSDAARRDVWGSFLDAVLAIHRVPPDGLGLRAGLDAELRHWREYLDWACDGAPPSLLVDALEWCAATRPAREPPGGLLWGDVRLGNVVFDAERLVPLAVLDWDMVTVGPIEMDLAWFLALEGLQADLTGMVVPGFGDREEAIERVASAVGRPLADLDWHEVFALVRASAVSTRIATLFGRAGRRTMFRVGEDPTLLAASARIEARS
jgi:aminoglycoside phosphotransferase (APT) family kinase protein